MASNAIDAIASLWHGVKEHHQTVKLFDRDVLVTVKGRIHKFKWVYDGEARDMASGETGCSRHLKSSTGAAKHALQELYDKSQEGGKK